MIKQVNTTSGIFNGLPGNNTRISVFKGIPFAAPPVGANRWRAPQPVVKSTDIINAYTFAPISVQDTPGLGTDIYCREWHVDPDIPMSEDCLYLNVWTSAKNTYEKLPVLVWFFGGAFQWGYTAEMEFCGENIAKRGVVLVSVNYRLGAFGFMAHPDITKESPDAPCNFGNLDQQAGLEWVKNNIEAFGGDPDNITIAGQSAGGASVLSHLTNKKSSSMIKRGVVFSGIIRNPYVEDKLITPGPLSQMEALGVEFFDCLGVKSLAEARELDAIYIRDEYAEFASTHPRFVPTIDGAFIEDDPFKMYLSGKHDNLPLLSGNTEDEFPYYDEDGTQIQFIEAATKAAMASNTANSYYYSFRSDIPGDDNPGTFHSVDLWFWFETLAACWRPFTGRHYDLARNMCNYFTNFIKTGDPNGCDCDGTEMPKWLPYNETDKSSMIFTSEGPTLVNNNDEKIDQMISQY